MQLWACAAAGCNPHHANRARSLRGALPYMQAFQGSFLWQGTWRATYTATLAQRSGRGRAAACDWNASTGADSAAQSEPPRKKSRKGRAGAAQANTTTRVAAAPRRPVQVDNFYSDLLCEYMHTALMSSVDIGMSAFCPWCPY